MVATAPSPEVGSPQAWLYVSKRLDLDWVPNEPIWNVLVFTAGTAERPVAYYRLSPGVLAWLEAAGARLEADALAGRTPRDQLDAYLDAMRTVWEFAAVHLHADAVRAATPELPECAGSK